MALLLLAHAARARCPLVLASVRPAHAGAGRDDGPVCRPPPCGTSATRAPPPPVRIACTPPPPTGHAPPCPSPALRQTLTCEDAMTKPDDRISHRKSAAATAEDRCGLELDAVARRLTAAERVRREHYEYEAARAGREPAPPADFARYCLSAATDADVPPTCPADTENCEIHRHNHADPCDQYPRREVHLDRGSEIPEGSKGFAARIMEKLKRANSAAEKGGLIRPRPCPPRADRCNPQHAPHTELPLAPPRSQKH